MSATEFISYRVSYHYKCGETTISGQVKLTMINDPLVNNQNIAIELCDVLRHKGVRASTIGNVFYYENPNTQLLERLVDDTPLEHKPTIHIFSAPIESSNYNQLGNSSQQITPTPLTPNPITPTPSTPNQLTPNRLTPRTSQTYQTQSPNNSASFSQTEEYVDSMETENLTDSRDNKLREIISQAISQRISQTESKLLTSIQEWGSNLQNLVLPSFETSSNHMGFQSQSPFEGNSFTYQSNALVGSPIIEIGEPSQYTVIANFVNSKMNKTIEMTVTPNYLMSNVYKNMSVIQSKLSGVTEINILEREEKRSHFAFHLRYKDRPPVRIRSCNDGYTVYQFMKDMDLLDETVVIGPTNNLLTVRGFILGIGFCDDTE